jgi:pentalenene oxygenase
VVEAIPQAPGALPLLGHALPLLRDPLRFLVSLPAHGDLVQIRIGPFRAMVVCDPALTQKILVNDRIFDKGGVFFDRLRESFGNGLPMSPHQLHRRQRRLTQPAFHHSRFPAYTLTMTEQIAAVVDCWDDGQTIDVLPEMQKITTRVLLATMFSTSLVPATITQTMDDLETIFSVIYRRMFLPDFLCRLPTGANRRYEQANARLRRTITKAVADRRRGHNLGSEGDDLLSMLLAARDYETDGQGLSDTELADQAMSFFAAGVETTANLLGWAFNLVSGNPDVENRLHSEVDTVLGGRPPTHLDLPELPFTSQIINETLRLYPPAWLLTRAISSDTSIAGHLLAAGTTIVFSPYLVHHRADLYPDPEGFDPERWAKDGGRVPAREAFIPFGGGARKCIGDQFGVTEAVLVIAMVATRWRLQQIPGNDDGTRAGVTLRPKRLRLRAVARET